MNLTVLLLLKICFLPWVGSSLRSGLVSGRVSQVRSGRVKSGPVGLGSVGSDLVGSS